MGGGSDARWQWKWRVSGRVAVDGWQRLAVDNSINTAPIETILPPFDSP
jgi:hypothetical protein